MRDGMAMRQDEDYLRAVRAWQDLLMPILRDTVREGKKRDLPLVALADLLMRAAGEAAQEAGLTPEEATARFQSQVREASPDSGTG